MTKKESYIFDSHALLKYFQKETGHQKIIDLLEDIETHHLKKYLNAINLGEILYIVKREFGDQKKIEVLANIERLKFITLTCPTDLIFRAAEYKAEYAMSYADCFVLASAVEHNAIIVTGDPEFKKAKDLATIIFV